MNATLTYSDDSPDTFDLDHPLVPFFETFRSWLRKNGFESITEFLVCVFFSILENF